MTLNESTLRRILAIGAVIVAVASVGLGGPSLAVAVVLLAIALLL